MMLSKFSRVILTCHEGRSGPWFELDWASRPNHSMTACHGTYTHVSSLLVICDARLWKRAQWTVKLCAGHRHAF
ncbi:hypothetical protein TIFTF001_016693 [Ficus carica]|uniref:Uncharacterized protein n=1 Tax=Ficus carica TaxID=3494 RepID=A0AA88A6R5_FICCA|nr:hypothetical protein TIFTF001_016693 [Ficus carica]